jgi:glutaminyl-tRNA synthetase
MLSPFACCTSVSSLAALDVGAAVQFERQGYFCRDPNSAPARLVFNRTIGLRDSWAKLAPAKAGQAAKAS